MEAMILVLLLALGILLILVIGALVVLLPLVRWSTASGITEATKRAREGSEKGNAKEILGERYARGEISKEQYKEMLEDLQESEYRRALQDFEGSQ
jgi:uncharacterized membrane protein